MHCLIYKFYRCILIKYNIFDELILRFGFFIKNKIRGAFYDICVFNEKVNWYGSYIFINKININVN